MSSSDLAWVTHVVMVIWRLDRGWEVQEGLAHMAAVGWGASVSIRMDSLVGQPRFPTGRQGQCSQGPNPSTQPLVVSASAAFANVPLAKVSFTDKPRVNVEIAVQAYGFQQACSLGANEQSNIAIYHSYEKKNNQNKTVRAWEREAEAWGHQPGSLEGVLGT